MQNKKFDYISDLHINFIFGESKVPNNKQIKAWFDFVFETKQSSTLIIAGDISESVAHSFYFFEKVIELYGYENIVFVFGNHDMWLSSGNSASKYKFKSYNKIKAMKELCKVYNETHNTKIILLDGEVIEIDSVKIAGAMGWYDTKYFYNNVSMYMVNKSPYDLWTNKMNDYRYILPKNSEYKWITDIEIGKVNWAIKQKPDIMITHICPVVSNTIVQEMYKNDLTNTFYMFDGLDLVYEYKPQFWIYGHMHGIHEFEIDKTTLLRNSHGYPTEHLNIRVKTLEVK